MKTSLKNPVFAVAVVLVLFGGSVWADGTGTSSRPPKEGYVPDEKTAIQIATAVWIPIYGEDVLKEKPFNAKLENGIWTVSGTVPTGSAGGTAIAEISKADGCILSVTHTQ